MNTLILKDERGAVEIVPSCEGIATKIPPFRSGTVGLVLLKLSRVVRALRQVISSTPSQNNLFYLLKLSRVMRALRLYTSFHLSLFTTHHSLFTTLYSLKLIKTLFDRLLKCYIFFKKRWVDHEKLWV